MQLAHKLWKLFIYSFCNQKIQQVDLLLSEFLLKSVLHRNSNKIKGEVRLFQIDIY